MIPLTIFQIPVFSLMINFSIALSLPHKELQTQHLILPYISHC